MQGPQWADQFTHLFSGYSPMVAIDVVTKMGHYVNCGTGSVGLEPHLNAFYGDPEI